MIVNICGIPHNVIECEDSFDTDTHLGQIDYGKAEIKINKNMPKALKMETICHEMVHGIFFHIGCSETAQNEQLVQALGNAIYQGFEIKDIEKGEDDG